MRFVEDASEQTPPPPATAAAHVVEGGNHNQSKSLNENCNSASRGDVGGGGLRARNVGGSGGSRVDPIDLKSALKNRQRERQQVAGLGVGVVNGGGGGNSNGNGGDSLDHLEEDLEGQGRLCGGVGGFEVEFKSTYPIDEPISHHQINNRLPPPQVQTIAQQQQMRLVNRKAQVRNSYPPAQQPEPKRPQHNQQINNNHVPESSTVPSSGGGFGRRKTYPVDKECCTVNQPCEDHEDFLEDEEDEDEDLDVDDEDEEGGIGGDNGSSVGVENGGNDDGGEEGRGYRNRNHLQHYTRCENKVFFWKKK